MRRILIGVTLASIAVAAVFLSRPDTPTDLREIRRLRIEWSQAQRSTLERELLRLDRLDREARGTFHIDPKISPIDPEISAMDCRVVAEEPLGGDRFLLTEECVWRGGHVERRQFEALRRQDGPVYGWMYRPTESET